MSKDKNPMPATILEEESTGIETLDRKLVLGEYVSFVGVVEERDNTYLIDLLPCHPGGLLQVAKNQARVISLEQKITCPDGSIKELSTVMIKVGVSAFELTPVRVCGSLIDSIRNQRAAHLSQLQLQNLLFVDSTLGYTEISGDELRILSSQLAGQIHPLAVSVAYTTPSGPVVNTIQINTSTVYVSHRIEGSAIQMSTRLFGPQTYDWQSPGSYSIVPGRYRHGVDLWHHGGYAKGTSTLQYN